MRAGFTPAEVDAMEVWQAAALLGADERPQVAPGADTFLGRPITEADKRRLEKFAEGPPTVDLTASVMAQMGIQL